MSWGGGTQDSKGSSDSPLFSSLWSKEHYLLNNSMLRTLRVFCAPSSLGGNGCLRGSRLSLKIMQVTSSTKILLLFKENFGVFILLIFGCTGAGCDTWDPCYVAQAQRLGRAGLVGPRCVGSWFPDQRPNSCLLRWEAGSQPLGRQSPLLCSHAQWSTLCHQESSLWI